MDFKFKDEDKKTEDEAVEKEAAESEAPGYDFAGQEGEETKVEESAALEPNVGESEVDANDVMESEATGGAGLEPYTGETDTVENDVMESEEAGVEVAGGGTVASEPAASRPKYQIPLEDEDSERSSFKLPIKQIFLVIVLLGGGYYVKTYHAKEGKPIRIKTPPVAEIQKSTPKVSSIEELPELLDESRELLESIREQKNRLKNQASARISSGNASSRRINFRALENHKGQWVTILMKDGFQREGRIVDVKDNILHLEQDYDYGTISVRVPLQKIAEVRK